MRIFILLHPSVKTWPFLSKSHSFLKPNFCSAIVGLFAFDSAFCRYLLKLCGSRRVWVQRRVLGWGGVLIVRCFLLIWLLADTTETCQIPSVFPLAQHKSESIYKYISEYTAGVASCAKNSGCNVKSVKQRVGCECVCVCVWGG